MPTPCSPTSSTLGSGPAGVGCCGGTPPPRIGVRRLIKLFNRYGFFGFGGTTPTNNLIHLTDELYSTYTQTFEWIFDAALWPYGNAKCIVIQKRDPITGAVNEGIDFAGGTGGAATTTLVVRSDSPDHGTIQAKGYNYGHFAEIAPLPVMAGSWDTSGVPFCTSTLFSISEWELRGFEKLPRFTRTPTVQTTIFRPFGQVSPVVMMHTEEVSDPIGDTFPCSIFVEETGPGSDIDVQLDTVPRDTDRIVAPDGSVTDSVGAVCLTAAGLIHPLCCVEYLNSISVWRGNEALSRAESYVVPDVFGSWAVRSQPDCFWQWRWAYGRIEPEDSVGQPFCLVGSHVDEAQIKILQNQGAGTVIGGIEWLRTDCTGIESITADNVSIDDYIGRSKDAWVQACAYFQPDWPAGCT